MKSIIIKTAACVTLLLATMLTSCDKNANDTPYATDGTGYYGDMHISLYVPDKRIENDTLSKDGCLDTLSNAGTMTFTIDTNDKLFITIAHNECPFAIPFDERRHSTHRLRQRIPCQAVQQSEARGRGGTAL